MELFMQTIAPLSVESGQVSWFESIVIFLQIKMEKPGLFGWYHLLCLGIMFALCVLIAWKAKNLTDKQIDIILGVTASVLILFEIYKQIVFSYNNGDWNYQWYIFPFQFCSTPMYVMLTASLVKNKTVKHACHAFMSTYGLFAGAAVMFYPGDVFIEFIGINIQTMVHHGVMFVIGVLLYVSGQVKAHPKSALPALPVFFTLLTVAMILNLSYGKLFGDPNQTFNMFYISPYHSCTLPLLNLFADKIPYVAFFFIYAGGFTALAFLMPSLAFLVAKLFTLFRRLFTPIAVKQTNTAKTAADENETNA